MMTWQWIPVFHPALIVLFTVALLVALFYGSRILRRKHIPRGDVWRLGILRLGMIALVTLCLFQPVCSVPKSVTDEPGLIVLVDRSASMSTAANNGTRWDELREQLARSPAVSEADRLHDVHWFAFDRLATPITPDEIDRLEPTGETTDIAASLKSAWNHVSLRNASHGVTARPSRLLLVSDGLNRGSTDVVATARELGLTIDVLPLSLTEANSDEAPAVIDMVQAARRVLVGSETAFQVSVRPNRSLESLTLVASDDGKELQRVELTNLIAAEVRFVIVKDRPKEAGLKRYEFRLEQAGQPLADPFAVNVQAVDDKHDVLVLEESWRWEFKYFRRVLEDDPSFNMTAFLERGGNAFVQFGEPDRRVKLGGFPQSRGELDGFDTIILGDVRPAGWPRGLARQIASSVGDNGKSLVVLAGRHLGDWIDTPEITRLLPVELTRESGLPLSGAIDVQLTPAGQSSNWFTLPPGQNAPSATITSLPTLEHVYPVLRKKPAATVLLETVGHQNAYGPLPVIVEQTYGRGRVLFIATDTLWRWQNYGPRTDDGVTLHAAFWQHAMRALAPTEPTSLNHQLFLRPARTQYRSGEAVRVFADQSATGTAADSDMVLEATVVMPDGRRVPASFRRAAELDGTPVIDFEATQLGRYRVEASARHEGQTLSETFVVIEVTGRGQEADAAPVDLAALENWASLTGGRVIDATSAEGWVSAEMIPQVTSIRQYSYDLWNNFTLLLLLCLLLVVDWTYRLFFGYV